MNRTHAFSGRTLAVARATLLAFLILRVNSGIWGALLISNLRTTPAIPWASPIMALYLWLMWQYLNGKWWPRSTQVARHRLLRARPVSGQVFAWSLVVGVLSIVALTGYWIVMFQLFKMAGNNLPDLSRSPGITAALVIVMASLVSPLSEEAAFRGYAQSFLERAFRGPAIPIIISSVLFALAHLTQGFYIPKLFVYFLTGVTFGGIAYVTRSILPSLAALPHQQSAFGRFTKLPPLEEVSSSATRSPRGSCSFAQRAQGESMGRLRQIVREAMRGGAVVLADRFRLELFSRRQTWHNE